MSLKKVQEYFRILNKEERIILLEQSSATVALAAQALHVEEARIAKTLSFFVKEQPVLIVSAGDARIDNAAYRHQFGCKAKMMNPSEAAFLIGHEVGGVCPFAVNAGVQVYLDESLKRFKTVFPAAGSSNSAIEMAIEELNQDAKACGWVDVCKGWRKDNDEQSGL